MILEANLHYPTGSSFDTIVKDLLGKGWNIINGLSVAFVLYILTYAYITSGGGITQNLLNQALGSAESGRYWTYFWFLDFLFYSCGFCMAFY